MKICVFSADEIKTMLTAMDYVDFCLEDVNVTPAGWDEKTFADVFVSARAKLLNFTTETDASADECVLLACVLRRYLYTPESFELTRTPPADAREALSAIQKIEQFPSA